MRRDLVCAILLSLLASVPATAYSSLFNSPVSQLSTSNYSSFPSTSIIKRDTERRRSGADIINAKENLHKESCCIPLKWNYLIESGIILTERNTSCVDEIGVLLCYCLTEKSDNSSSHDRIIGQCFYSCFHHGTRYPTEYQKVSCSNGFTDGGVCARFKREGALCGRCSEGYGPPVYSFSLQCVSCANVSLWTTLPLYVLTAYGPLTVFLAVIVFFTLSVNSAPLRGWILVCQCLSSYIVMLLLNTMATYRPDYRITYFIRAITSIYGVWNLDFFRPVYKPFCLHPSLTTLQVMSLDYIIAAYPLVLIVVMYAMVDMYSHNVRPVVVIGRVFHHCCIRCRHRLDIKTSLVDAFGTFFSLSYVKFLNTSVNLLMSTRTIDSQGRATRLVYFDGTMEFFKGEHVAFAMMAAIFGLVCNIFPLVVIFLYSFPRTHRILNILPVSVQTAMFPFMDNILASYKDGTNGTRNCRYFAVVYHLALFTYICSFAWTKTAFALGLSTMMCILVGMLVAVIQPYKSKIQNTVDVILILGVGLFYAGAMTFLIAYSSDPMEQKPALALAGVSSLIPFFYFLSYAGFKFFRLICGTYNYITSCYRSRNSMRLLIGSSGSEFDRQPLLQ